MTSDVRSWPLKHLFLGRRETMFYSYAFWLRWEDECCDLLLLTLKSRQSGVSGSVFTDKRTVQLQVNSGWKSGTGLLLRKRSITTCVMIKILWENNDVKCSVNRSSSFKKEPGIRSYFPLQDTLLWSVWWSLFSFVNILRGIRHETIWKKLLFRWVFVLYFTQCFYCGIFNASLHSFYIQ